MEEEGKKIDEASYTDICWSLMFVRRTLFGENFDEKEGKAKATKILDPSQLLQNIYEVEKHISTYF